MCFFVGWMGVIVYRTMFFEKVAKFVGSNSFPPEMFTFTRGNLENS